MLGPRQVDSYACIRARSRDLIRIEGRNAVTRGLCRPILMRGKGAVIISIVARSKVTRGPRAKSLPEADSVSSEPVIFAELVNCGGGNVGNSCAADAVSHLSPRGRVRREGIPIHVRRYPPYEGG